ncbi:MAG: DMT family transporter, partial [Clostridia bacterium]|nr:DMT family transporter [Clostridia bacterium]
MSKKMKSNLLLLLTTVIWGTAFVAQKSGADIGNFTFGGIRTFIGGLVLIPVILLMNGGKKESSAKTDGKMNLIGGVACGVALFIASTLQQFGVSMTSVSKSGFLTTLYVVFVPLISIFLRKKIRPVMWLCV